MDRRVCGGRRRRLALPRRGPRRRRGRQRSGAGGAAAAPPAQRSWRRRHDGGCRRDAAPRAGCRAPRGRRGGGLDVALDVPRGLAEGRRRRAQAWPPAQVPLHDRDAGVIRPQRPPLVQRGQPRGGRCLASAGCLHATSVLPRERIPSWQIDVPRPGLLRDWAEHHGQCRQRGLGRRARRLAIPGGLPHPRAPPCQQARGHDAESEVVDGEGHSCAAPGLLGHPCLRGPHIRHRASGHGVGVSSGPVPHPLSLSPQS